MIQGPSYHRGLWVLLCANVPSGGKLHPRTIEYCRQTDEHRNKGVNKHVRNAVSKVSRL